MITLNQNAPEEEKTKKEIEMEKKEKVLRDLTVTETFNLLIEKLLDQEKRIQNKAQAMMNQNNLDELEKLLPLMKELSVLIKVINSHHFTWKGLNLVEVAAKPDIIKRTSYGFDSKKERIVIKTMKEDLSEVPLYRNYISYKDFMGIITRLFMHMREHEQVKTKDLMEEEESNRTKVDRCFRILMKESFLARKPGNQTYYQYTFNDSEQRILKWIYKEDKQLYNEFLNTAHLKTD